jgi:two-component system, NtrC family, nitrogen regulation sensor histidine kinase NtrY
VSLRTRFVVYLAAVHVLMAVVAGWLVAQNRLWLVGAELVLIASFVTGLALVRRFFASVEFVQHSARLLEDSDFMSRVREVGQEEIDRLVRLYNRMIDSLRAERVRLQEQHQFLGLVLRESPAAVVVLDFDRRVSLMNPAAERLLQSPATPILGRTLDALERPLADALASLAEGERRVVTLWGGRRLRIWHGTFLDRSFRRSFYLLEELTEELRQSEKAAYEKLIRMLSHEVNNTVGASSSLLNSCLRYSDQLAPPDRADFEHALGVVIARTEQLNRFMGSFADVVRLPAPRLEPVEPGELVDDILRLVQPQALERRIKPVRDGTATVGAVPMDRAQMTQALLNVVKNAIEAIECDGVLTVRLSGSAPAPVIEVEDTGPDLAEDVRENLFTPFFSTKEGGQGIGLTLVQEILTGHRFPFALERLSAGITRFTIVLSAQSTQPGVPQMGLEAQV